MFFFFWSFGGYLDVYFSSLDVLSGSMLYYTVVTIGNYTKEDKKDEKERKRENSWVGYIIELGSNESYPLQH